MNQILKKLDHKMIGLFEIIVKKNISQELQPLQTMKIYNVVYLNLF